MTTPATERQSQSKRVSIGWIRHDWRVCDEEECPKRTPKTLDAPLKGASAIATEEKPAPQPQPIEPIQPEESIQQTKQSAHETNEIVVRFPLAKAIPTPDGLATLQETLPEIKKRGVAKIEGRTDDLGSQDVNNRLARERAEFVAAWLKKQNVGGPIKIDAKGKCCYARPNESDEDRATNRRAVIVLKEPGNISGKP